MAGNNVNKTSSVRIARRAPVTTADFEQILKTLDFNRDGKVGVKYTVIVKKDGSEEVVKPNPGAGMPTNVARFEERGEDEIDAYLRRLMPSGFLFREDPAAVQRAILKDLGINLSIGDIKENYTSTLAFQIKKMINPANYDAITRADWNRARGVEPAAGTTAP